MSAMTADVTICECFARDGLQHEPDFIATDTKRALIERFAALGFTRIEATSYSNPKIVPQFADASELLTVLPRKDGVFYKATCANFRAAERALQDASNGIGVNEISMLVSASEKRRGFCLSVTTFPCLMRIIAACTGGLCRIS